MIKNRISEKKYIVIYLLILIIVGSYIVYLNLSIYNLQNNVKNKNELNTIQINNRINEINLLNNQLTDLQQILDIGLDLSKNDNIYFSTKLNEKDKSYILNNIPSGSPLKKTFITSNYGYRTHPTLYTRKLHTGLDFKALIGTQIYAPANGVVVIARNYDPGGYGKMIVIAHNFGFKTLFAHLSNVFIKEGDIISKGTLLGLSGNTGTSTGPHLHYEVKFAEKYTNPIDFVYWNNKTFNTIFNKKAKINWEKLILLIKQRTYKTKGS